MGLSFLNCLNCYMCLEISDVLCEGDTTTLLIRRSADARKMGKGRGNEVRQLAMKSINPVKKPKIQKSISTELITMVMLLLGKELKVLSLHQVTL